MHLVRIGRYTINLEAMTVCFWNAEQGSLCVDFSDEMQTATFYGDDAKALNDYIGMRLTANLIRTVEAVQ